MAVVPTPPPDLDTRYRPYRPFAEWLRPEVELTLFDDAAAELDRECRAADEATVRAALDFALRAAAFDTGAIEGLYGTDRGITFTIAAQAAAWESVLAEASGDEARRYFDAQLHGFDLVLDVATTHTPISAAWLRALHETVCAGQDRYRALTPIGWADLPLPKGAYKQAANHVLQPDGTWHAYAPVDQTQPEVQRLVDEMGSAGFGAAHPIEQAAYVHHALVGIHPFADGNGRVARALASVFLYRAARVPLLVFADQRTRYLAALRAADHDDATAFTRFVRDITIDTIELMIQRLQTARTSGVVGDVTLSGDAGETGPQPHAEHIRFLADRLHTAVRDELRDNAARLSAGGLSLRILPAKTAGDQLQQPPATQVVARSPRSTEPITTTIHVTDDPNRRWPLQVITENQHHRPTVAPMRVRLDNIYPALTTSTQQRIRDWARQVVNTLAAELRARTM